MRACVFLVVWQVHALESSFGYINHQWYPILYTSFVLMFVPNVWKTRTFSSNRAFLMGIWFAQAIFALTYTMAGFNKIVTAVEQYIAGEIHGLSMYGLAYQVADWTLKLQETAPLAAFIIHYPFVGWVGYVVVQFIQLFTFWIMVRPSLQKFWAAALILFHFGTWSVMGIIFQYHVLLLIALFVHSPFVRPYSSFKEFLTDFPIIGIIIESVRSYPLRLRFFIKGV